MLNEQNDQKFINTYANAWMLRWEKWCNEMHLTIRIDATRVTFLTTRCEYASFKTERTTPLVLFGVIIFVYDNEVKAFPSQVFVTVSGIFLN